MRACLSDSVIADCIKGHHIYIYRVEILLSA
jgi:hypothetical protein